MKKFTISLIFILILINDVYSQDDNWNSISSVMEYFVNSIKNGNIEQTVQTSPYYYDEIISKFDPKESIMWMTAILPTGIIMPVEYKVLYKYFNLSGYSKNIQTFIWSLLLYEKYPEFLQMSPIHVNNDYKIIEEYLNQLDINRLKDLELIRIDLYKPDLQTGEGIKRLNEVKQRIYGFEEQWQYTALYKFNNKFFVGGFTTEKYEDKWYISNLNCSLANFLGGLIICPSVAEYVKAFDYEL